MSRRDRVAALTILAVRRAVDALARTGNRSAWADAMRRAIAAGHQAAAWAALDERRPIGPLRRLARAIVGPLALPGRERAMVADAVTTQIRFLTRFLDDIRNRALSPAQIAARSDLYALAVRSTYDAVRWADWDIPDRLLPGRQICLANCRCTISIRDHGDGTGTLTRSLNGERHCSECPSLAGDHRISRRR